MLWSSDCFMLETMFIVRSYALLTKKGGRIKLLIIVLNSKYFHA
jgi:hypothetical protein